MAAKPLSILTTVKDCLTVVRSPFWDSRYYAEANPDVVKAGKPKLLHFIRHGGFEGRSPSPKFDAKFYLAANADVVRDGEHPLTHYIRAGRSQGRLPVKPTGQPCPICGSGEFIFGPGKRYGILQQLPQCKGCNSLERHRALRLAWLALPKDILGAGKALQFSFDRSIDPKWFGAYELSTYGGENSIDLMQIDRPDASYDIVICNHVLEHVPDDRKAFAELVRITSPEGFLQVSFPEPLVRKETDDWGHPRANDHDHFRRFGADAPKRLRERTPNLGGIEVLTHDPVTGISDLIYIFSKSEAVLNRLSGTLTGFHQVRI